MSNVIQPLVFKSSIEETIWYKNRVNGFNNIATVIVDRDNLIPLQLTQQKTIAHDDNKESVSLFEIIDYTTEKVVDITGKLTFIHSNYGQTTDREYYIFYDGRSTVTPLKQGIYYIHCQTKEKDDTSSPTVHLDNYYSELFKVGFFNTISFEYGNDVRFGGVWHQKNKLFKATYQGRSFSLGDRLEYSEVNKDPEGFDVPIYRRFSPIETVSIMADSHAISVLDYMKMSHYQYITNEAGIRQQVIITDILSTPASNTNYLSIQVKYRIQGNDIISSNDNNSNDWFIEEGEVSRVPEAGVFVGKKKTWFGNKKITL